MKITCRVILNLKELTGYWLRTTNLKDTTSESHRPRVGRVLSSDNGPSGSGGSIGGMPAMGRPVRLESLHMPGEREKKKKKHKNLDERKRGDWSHNNAN